MDQAWTFKSVESPLWKLLVKLEKANYFIRPYMLALQDAMSVYLYMYQYGKRLTFYPQLSSQSYSRKYNKLQNIINHAC